MDRKSKLRTVSSCSNPQPVSQPINVIGSDNDHVMNVINDIHPHAHVSQNNALEEDDNTISNDNVEVDESNMPREEHEKFERLLKQAQRELYPRSEGFSVLTTIVEFMHGKVILCKLEQIFPPAFFDVMIHVMIHLVDEAILARPVNFRWMYPTERLLGRFKRYVQNKARPEGSITVGYLSNESLTFCGMYLCNVESSFNRRERNIDGGV